MEFYSKCNQAELEKMGDNRKQWVISSNENCPQQDNGYDCGLFVLRIIEY